MREQSRWWPAVGVIVGLATYNKYLIAMLVLGLAVGLVAVERRLAVLSALRLTLGVPPGYRAPGGICYW